MELLSSFYLNPYRIYRVSKRVKSKKGISTFPAKHIESYLDYSVDFSNQLSDGEVITEGKVSCNHSELQINLAFIRDDYLTVFLSGGKEGLSFYLTFIIKTNKGNELCQEIILPTYGSALDVVFNLNYKFITLDHETVPPNHEPPLNALMFNDYYFVLKNNSYILV